MRLVHKLPLRIRGCTLKSLVGGLEILAGPPLRTGYVVRFARRKAPTDLSYAVEASTNFISWQTDGAAAQEILPPADDGNGVTETAAFLVLPGSGSPAQTFIRLKVTLGP